MTKADTFMQEYERHRRIWRELGVGNKAAIFDALTAANITEVLVEFDGEGDSLAWIAKTRSSVVKADQSDFANLTQSRSWFSSCAQNRVSPEFCASMRFPSL